MNCWCSSCHPLAGRHVVRVPHEIHLLQSDGLRANQVGLGEPIVVSPVSAIIVRCQQPVAGYHRTLTAAKIAG